MGGDCDSDGGDVSVCEDLVKVGCGCGIVWLGSVVEEVELPLERTGLNVCVT